MSNSTQASLARKKGPRRHTVHPHDGPQKEKQSPPYLHNTRHAQHTSALGTVQAIHTAQPTMTWLYHNTVGRGRHETHQRSIQPLYAAMCHTAPNHTRHVHMPGVPWAPDQAPPQVHVLLAISHQPPFRPPPGRAGLPSRSPLRRCPCQTHRKTWQPQAWSPSKQQWLPPLPSTPSACSSG